MSLLTFILQKYGIFFNEREKYFIININLQIFIFENYKSITSVAEMKKQINNDSEYNKIMAKIDSLTTRGSDHISKEQLAEIRELALIAQEYEQKKYMTEPPGNNPKHQ